MTWGAVREGDWVRNRATMPVTISDHLSKSGIKPGTRGVVTATTGSRANVTFDGGIGTVSTTVPIRSLRVVRRGGGVDRFATHQSRLNAARAALALFLAWPVISWVIQYVWINKSFSGMIPAFAVGVLQSIGDWITLLVTSPLHTVIYLVFLAILGKLAWR